MKLTAVILAAGHGTRMRSSLAKVLHPLAGKPLIEYSLEAVKDLSDDTPVVIIGHDADNVRETVGSRARFVMQEQQLGTAHAVLSAEPILVGKTDLILVTSADMPLLTANTLDKLVQVQRENSGPITMLTLHNKQSRGFGRIIRDGGGAVLAIVEEAQANSDQLSIEELNAGVYCFRANWLWDALRRIEVSPKGEYYLTDTVAVAVMEGQRVQSLSLNDSSEAIGINNRVHLAEAERVLQDRINFSWMIAGVTIKDPETVYIDADVHIGQDTVLLPNTHLRGSTVIGEGSIIGPNTIVEDTKIGNNCKVFASVLEGALLENHVEIGPFGHLRKGAHLCEGVHMGNFGEVKNSRLSPGVKMGHFSYIGDAQIGENVNIGAGTITCNFDGTRKHPTEIGADAFIGSSTMLVAPLIIGERARTGAGSVVTHDVPADTVVVGVPARPMDKNKNK